MAVENPRPDDLGKVKSGNGALMVRLTHPPDTMKVRFSIFISFLYVPRPR